MFWLNAESLAALPGPSTVLNKFLYQRSQLDRFKRNTSFDWQQNWAESENKDSNPLQIRRLRIRFQSCSPVNFETFHCVPCTFVKKDKLDLVFQSCCYITDCASYQKKFDRYLQRTQKRLVELGAFRESRNIYIWLFTHRCLYHKVSVLGSHFAAPKEIILLLYNEK